MITNTIPGSAVSTKNAFRWPSNLTAVDKKAPVFFTFLFFGFAVGYKTLPILNSRRIMLKTIPLWKIISKSLSNVRVRTRQVNGSGMQKGANCDIVKPLI